LGPRHAGSTDTLKGITYGTLNSQYQLGAGDDVFIFERASGADERAGRDGNDTFNVGSAAPALGGILDGVAGLLISKVATVQTS
jgi:hypothetical protein